MNAATQIGRLALRHEGENWNAYYAMPNTMDGALFLGSIRISIVTKNEGCKNAFMNLMRLAVGDILKDVVGREASWKSPEAAPEHERAGHG